MQSITQDIDQTATAGAVEVNGLAFTGLLKARGIAISMDSKGAWRDDIFVERLGRSVKYEEVYLRAYDSVAEARAWIGRLSRLLQREAPAFEP